MQIEVKTEKGKVLFVGLEKVDREITINGVITTFRYKDKSFRLPSKFKDLGLASQMTEEMAAEICQCSKHEMWWRDYDYKKEFKIKFKDVRSFTFKTALESFHSLMRANEVYTENPFGEEPSHYNYQNDDCETDLNEFYSDLKQWQEAQSRTSPEWIVIQILEG